MLVAFTPWLLLLSLAAYGLLLWVIYAGALRRSRFAAPVAGAIAGLLVGVLFKIQHWSGSGGLLMGCGLALAGLYGAWFARKPAKTRLDLFKLSYVLSLGLWAVAMGLGWRVALPWLSSLLHMSMWAVLLDFLYGRYLRRPPPARYKSPS
ncbi:hypothetical protein [Hymenobacter actinosclerus]|uniref:Uncharacterized protein n=1 Tax=Hymenobacter actinosclerus TaxID=82805 RepID=A0A1I0C448_9BACT|nr:hypothetical protein [Hymenobacter actinosclerus]SET14048.1 hypothetical protein SAMN04487998_1298 [Hymenobacter actinosclerus]